MNLGPRANPTFANSNFASPRVAEPPQYAEFDASKKGGAHEDALPEMPSWETSNSKKVLVEGEDVELEQLNKPANGAAAAANGQNLPLMTGATGTPGPASPIRSPDHTTSPYGPPGGHAAAGGYLAAGGAGGDPYAMDGQGYNHNGAYDDRTPQLNADQGYGMAGGAMAVGRRSPRDYNDGGYGQDHGRAGGYPAQGAAFDDRSRQGPYDDHSGQGPYDGYGHQADGFGMGPGRYSPPRGNPNMRDAGYGDARRSPAPGGARRSPAPGAATRSPGPGGARRSPAPRGDYSRHGNYTDNTAYAAPRPLRQPPQRQFSHDVPPSPTSLQNNAGFDFNSGYSRRPSPAAAPAPQQQQAGYPGYRAYQPNQEQEGWSGL
jgi:hypothetical protein